MSKFKSAVAKHEKAVFRTVTAVALVAMFAVAAIDMDNMVAVMGIVIGYVFFLVWLLGVVAETD
jgi:hypothetical protein